MAINKLWRWDLNELSVEPTPPKDILLAQAKYFNEAVSDLHIILRDGKYLDDNFITLDEDGKPVDFLHSEEKVLVGLDKILVTRFVLVNQFSKTINLLEVSRINHYPLKAITFFRLPGCGPGHESKIINSEAEFTAWLTQTLNNNTLINIVRNFGSSRAD